MKNVDSKIKNDIETLLTVAKPKLIEAYRNADAKLYHKISEEFIFVANRLFMYLYENSDITWFESRSFGSSLFNLSFWNYTNLVQSFCDYLELRSKEIAYAAS